MNLSPETFLLKVEKTPTCWIWKGARNGSGYGTIRDGGGRPRNVSAHRLSYRLFSGLIPDNMCVCHRCDIPLCVNPAHLFLGTNADNMRDRDAKGRCRSRGLPGEGSGMARLKNESVIKILSDKRTHAAIATDYGVARSTITHVKLRRTWKHLSTKN